MNLNIFNRKKNIEDFMDADQAYQRSIYKDQYTEQELIEKTILELQREIKMHISGGLSQECLLIRTFSDYREKFILEKVAKFFRDKNYKVDLHNDADYEDTNVLIINYQNLEHFRKEQQQEENKEGEL